MLGRNCRFLQGPLTDKAEVQRMRDAMTANPPRAVTVKLLNYKVNGQPFWNALHVAPIRGADGQVSVYSDEQDTSFSCTKQYMLSSVATQLLTSDCTGIQKLLADVKVTRHAYQ